MTYVVEAVEVRDVGEQRQVADDRDTEDDDDRERRSAVGVVYSMTCGTRYSPDSTSAALR